jgi:hypothetical protein
VVLLDEKDEKRLKTFFKNLRKELSEKRDLTKIDGICLEIKNNPSCYPKKGAIGKLYKISRGQTSGDEDAIDNLGYVKNVSPDLIQWDYPLIIKKKKKDEKGNIFLEAEITFIEANPNRLPGYIDPTWKNIEIEMFQ